MFKKQEEYVGRHRKRNPWPTRSAIGAATLTLVGGFVLVINQEDASETISEAATAQFQLENVVVPREPARIHLPADRPPEPKLTAVVTPTQPQVAQTTVRPPVSRQQPTTTVRRPSPRPVAPQPTRAAPAPPPARSSNLVDVAKRYVNSGLRYCWGGKDIRSCVDCSGFVWNVMKQAGYNVPYRSSAALKDWAIPVSRSAARAGDLVLYSGHVGIYAGGNMMIDHGGTPGAKLRAVYGSPSFGRIP